jgi:hypothetical protein
MREFDEKRVKIQLLHALPLSIPFSIVDVRHIKKEPQRALLGLLARAATGTTATDHKMWGKE